MPPSTHSSTVLAPFQSLFSAPTLNQVQGRLWRKVQRPIIRTLLARGRRTVTAALRHTGQDNTPSFSLYHQVFNRARWSALKGSRCLLSLLDLEAVLQEVVDRGFILQNSYLASIELNRLVIERSGRGVGAAFRG